MSASRPAAIADVRRQRALLAVVAAGVFFAADDQTSVVTVLPAMASGIGITVDQFYRLSWIVNGYLLGYIVALPIVGRVADVYGHARVYAGALAVFLLGSALVAGAPTFEWLVVSRALQAVGGGAVVPVGMAIVVAELPPSRRLAGLGAIAAASEAGALLGPLWGGGITELWGWRWVFWINLPMVAPLALLAWRLAGHEARAGVIDWPGAALLASALGALTFALVDDPLNPRPIALTAALVAVSAGLAVAFVGRESHAEHPVLRLAMLTPRAVWAAYAVHLLVGGGLIVALIGVPLFVNLVLVESPLEGGLTLLRLTVMVPLGALAGGWLGERWSLRGVAALGLTLTAFGFIGLQAWDRALSEALRSAPQLVAGLGFGLVIAPLSASVLEHVREDERAAAASWLTLARVVGMLVGAALLTSRGLGRFYARAGSAEFGTPEFDALVAQAQVSTFREVFIAAAVVMAVAAPLALLIAPRARGEPDARWWAGR